MAPEEAPGDRRRHQRFRLGFPVNVHLTWRADPVTVEMIDIGAKGARFRSRSGALSLDQEAAFGFVTPGRDVCVASGRVLRLDRLDRLDADGQVDGEDQFVLSVERANAAFHGFLVSLAG